MMELRKLSNPPPGNIAPAAKNSIPASIKTEFSGVIAAGDSCKPLFNKDNLEEVKVNGKEAYHVYKDEQQALLAGVETIPINDDGTLGKFPVYLLNYNDTYYLPVISAKQSENDWEAILWKSDLLFGGYPIIIIMDKASDNDTQYIALRDRVGDDGILSNCLDDDVYVALRAFIDHARLNPLDPSDS